MKGNKEEKEEEDNNNRKSEEFVFDEAQENYIGKHTGVFHGRQNPKKKTFDGFPRFSEYLSRSENDEMSLAKESSKDSESQISIKPSEHLEQKETSKGFSQDVRTVGSEELNSSSRNPEYLLPGFGENVISSVKRRSSSIRPSEVKNIKEILMGMDGSGEFEYNEMEYSWENIKKSDENEYKSENKVEQKQYKNKKGFARKSNLIDHEEESKKILKTVVPEESGVGKKKKRESRVSFKETVLINEFGSESKVESQDILKLENEEFNILEKEIPISEIRMSRRLKLKQPQEDSNTILPHKIVKVKKEDVFVPEEESRDEEEQREEELYYFNEYKVDEREDEDYEYHEERKIIKVKYEPKKPEENIAKLNKRQQKAKKELRLVDDSMSSDIPVENVTKEIPMKKKSSKQGKKNQKKGKEVNENQSNKLNNRKNSEISEGEYEESKEEQVSQSQSHSESPRYPKRVRVKPVQFWENEKVHYKAGKAVGIERAALDFKELLQTEQGEIQHKFNINLHNNEIEVEIILPPKKEFISRGIRSPYTILFISISEKSMHIKNMKVYFEDGIRSEQIKENSIIEVLEARQFEIQNKSDTSIIIQMKLL